uniref:Immunoglobulin V-set domain-containing protein n=1 Tax=Seriola lalandi dorsalis TaxID=1841481 RepID=A0A3B4XUN3_SERLL
EHITLLGVFIVVAYGPFLLCAFHNKHQCKEEAQCGDFILNCKYDTSRFMYSKKYWCRGDNKNTCEILVDSELVVKTRRRFHILDARKRGLFVKVTNLQFDDTGVYWVGIDKVYADIMTMINIHITEVLFVFFKYIFYIGYWIKVHVCQSLL